MCLCFVVFAVKEHVHAHYVVRYVPQMEQVKIVGAVPAEFNLFHFQITFQSIVLDRSL